MIEDLDDMGRLAVVAAQAIIDYNDSNPEVGFWRNDRHKALLTVLKRSKVSLDIENILKEWEDEDYQKERERHKCPVCKKPMVKRKNKKTGVEFWGCEDFRDREHKIKEKRNSVGKTNTHDRKINSYLSTCTDDNNYWDAMDDMLFGSDLGPY